MKYNNIADIAEITTIPEDTLDKLIQKSVWCICDNVNETYLSETDNISEINIGIGTLIIQDGDEIHYKFIPSTVLEENVRETLINHKNPLQLILEKTLKNRIIHTYKDII